MTDLLNWLKEFYPILISGSISLITAIVSLVCLIKSKGFARYLKEAKERETYIVCPHCKKTIPLSEMAFHLPNGDIDNNLNGVPDKDE